MKNNRAILWICLAITMLFTSCSEDVPTRKTIFILVDGIPADVLESTNTPNLDIIAEAGGYARAYVGGEVDGISESPTISAVSYNCLLTGTWANKHNVWGNGIEAPDYDYWSIFKVFENANPDYQTAIFSTWEDNRTKLLGERLPATGDLQLDYSFDGFELDTVRFPHDEDKRYLLNIDELVSKEAAAYLNNNGPDLSWVYLEYTDAMGHRYGDSPEMIAAVESADAQIGRIWKSIQERGKKHNEEWMIVITTDHGRTADTGKGHGGQSDRERTTWIVTNLDDLTPAFNNQPAIVDIMPSICDFMGVEIPDKIKAQLDGVSFLKAR